MPSSPAPTGSPRTATQRTRSGRIRWPSSRGTARHPVLRRRAGLDPRPRDARRRGHPDRGARPCRGDRPVSGPQPGVRRHAGRADRRDRDRGGHPPGAVQQEPRRGGAGVKAIVLAAGYATRLYPLTLERPKALLEIGGRPMLDRVLERVLALGDVDESIVVTNAKFAPQFEEWAVDKHRVTVVNDGTSTRGRPPRRDRRHRLRAGARSASTTTSSSWPGTTCSRLTSRGSAAPPATRRAPVLAVRDVGDIAEMPKYNQVQTDERRPGHVLRGEAWRPPPRR